MGCDPGINLPFVGCNVTCNDSTSVTQHITYKHSIESSSVNQYPYVSAHILGIFPQI